ncbi:hypothetical protein COCMIDRAFT_41156 [Bipolaris oryzae ATCC 44560]|uniref:Cytochrome P450 monooxygenase n=1 Tax=Bipolaris oryzae ATCC 44560 TaxID=930090 RepID=W6YY80_COCMI|nr:uncharacterized protein COCMIDRAFT_41156 [Bipolaris oryzae ATCC 44560]EUC40519.1 hypothetical protein COCMIDRAFT_41156 [Bipolaris oryzae ATCC 44560]
MLIIFAVTLFGLTLLVAYLRPSNGLPKIPLFGLEIGNKAAREYEYLNNARNIYREAYQKFRDSAYRVTTTEGEQVVLPHRLLEELRSKSDEYLSGRKALGILLEKKHSGLPSESDLLDHIVRADLTPGLTRINNKLSKEIEDAVATEIPCCDDWIAVNINQKLLRIVAIASGINYTVDLFVAIRALKKWPKPIRWIGAYFTPSLKLIQEHRKKAIEFLGPVIQRRKEVMAGGGKIPDDVLQWTINKAAKFNRDTTEDIAYTQLTLSLAAIHSTSSALTGIIYDLVAMPDIHDALRDEIQAALEANGGVLSPQALYSMKLMDSFIKESMRLNPASFGRSVGYPFVMSDGTHLPSKTIISVANEAISQDPSIFPSPGTFDPYRYYNQRKIGSEHVNRHQAVTVTSTSLTFGYGKHVCPGRFFAVHEMKLILANLLMQFDVKMNKDDTGRIPNIDISYNTMPDVTKTLLVKRRTF